MNRDLQSKEIFDPVFSKAVPRYIAHCQKSKQKYEKLYPKCVEIFTMEIKNVSNENQYLYWGMPIGQITFEELKEPVDVYEKEDGNLYFKPYGKEELVNLYFSNDLILLDFITKKELQKIANETE